MSNIINFPGCGEYDYSDEFQDAVNHVCVFTFEDEEFLYDKLEALLLSCSEVIAVNFGKEEAALMLHDALKFVEHLR